MSTYKGKQSKDCKTEGKGSSYGRKYSNNNSRGKRKGKSDGGRTKAREAVDDSESFDNNPDWYNIDQVTTDQANNFSFSNYIGATVSLNPTLGEAFSKGTHGAFTDQVNVGSICRIMLNPSIGSVGLSADTAKVAAINQQGFKMYSRLSSVNSKNTQYLPNDVTTLILAIGELISTISWGQRALGLSWIYNLRNRTMPKQLIEASGFDATSLFSNLSNNRIRFNTLMVEANKIPFPSNINYFQKCSQIYSSVYKDEESDMSQMYVFVPNSTWDMDETYSKGTALITHNYFEDYSKTITWDNYLEVLSTKITSLMNSATFNYVYSDILNYASRNAGNTSVQMLHFDTVPEDYVVMPEYNIPMLSQIHNLNVLGDKFYAATNPISTTTSLAGDLDFTKNNDIYPDTDSASLFYKPLFIRGADEFVQLGLAATMDRILDFHVPPDTNMRLEATRLTSGCLNVTRTSKASGQVMYYDLVSSDHYVTSLSYYSSVGRTPQYIPTALDSGDIANTDGFGLMCNFNESPTMIEIEFTGQLTDAGWELADNPRILSRLDFFTTLSLKTLKLINDLGLYGLFEPADFEYGGIIRK